MDISQENGQLATGPQQLGKFDGGNEVSAVRSSSSCSVFTASLAYALGDFGTVFQAQGRR